MNLSKFKINIIVRRLFLILLLVFFTFSLYGCSNNNSKPNSEYNVSHLSNNETVEPSYEEILVSKFSTKLLGSDKNRNTNIKLACDEINGTIIEPGKTFSFWNIVKDTSKEKGYKEAEALDGDGEKIQALGGGICQISSTIYNAVLKDEDKFEVVERHPHSDDVAYVPKGKDASVNKGTADFKFKNNSEFPIKIYTKVENKKVKVEIYELK